MADSLFHFLVPSFLTESYRLESERGNERESEQATNMIKHCGDFCLKIAPNLTKFEFVD